MRASYPGGKMPPSTAGREARRYGVLSLIRCLKTKNPAQVKTWAGFDSLTD